MKTICHVFISAPLTGNDPIVKLKECSDVFAKLQSAGYTPECVNGLYMSQHYIHPIPYVEWMEYAIQRVLRSDAIVCLGRSPGTDTEVAVAIDNNIPVYYNVDEFIATTAPKKLVSLSAYSPSRVSDILREYGVK